MTTYAMTKLLRAACAALVLALVPGLAAAAPADGAADTLKLTLASVPDTVLEMAPAARAVAASGYSDVGHLALGGTLGFGAGDFTEFKLLGDLQYTVSEISPRVYFDFAADLGFGFGDFFEFQVVPKARFRYAVDSKLSLYGDAGFGFALLHKSDTTVGFPPFTFTVPGYTNGYGLFRFGFGLQYKVTPTIILVGEPVGMNIYFGNGSAFQYSFLVGALFRV